MEKIFDEEVISYLKSTGVSEKEINKIKFKKTKELSLDRLRLICELIEKEEFEEIKKYLSYSPSGDGYGCENYFIDFNFITGGRESVDTNDLSMLLRELKILSK
jgi:hypothetical protein